MEKIPLHPFKMFFLQAYALRFGIKCSRKVAGMILIQKSRGVCAGDGAGSHNVALARS